MNPFHSKREHQLACGEGGDCGGASTKETSSMSADKPTKKRKSGIPTGNAGEYFVMGELLRRGFDAQLADRNTRGYDLLVSRSSKPMQRVQVKTVRSQP